MYFQVWRSNLYLLKFSIAKFGFKYVSLISFSLWVQCLQFFASICFLDPVPVLLNFDLSIIILSVLSRFMPQFLYLFVTVSLCLSVQFTSRFSIAFWFVLPNSTILYGLDRGSCVSLIFVVYLSMRLFCYQSQTGMSDVKFK